ncbi:MAG TPA: AsmA family protein [Acidobacteriaceae bacterium]|nr:AsmA family protein [Acidobacteriaceae bacterium]
MIELEDSDRMEFNEQRMEHARRRQRVMMATAMVLVLLLLAITPPLLNVGRYQRRIVTSMSESLGRPVHLDKVTLHLLPMPGFTLQNFVVSEDPAFGNEPTIRANEVVATLRVSSLWQERVEFSRVKFVDPSVNLVRSADGRWNLEGVLLRASQVNTAPTAQQRAGPAPRFPYIEATGGRINLKLGQEKMPFSLTDADFALWLPSPQEWHVRLEGKPSRTDANIGDPGTVRLEGSLQRAARMQDVPVNVHASWYDAPLGEASRLVSGSDRDWRGTLHSDVWLQGPLAAAALKMKVTLVDLRRADFVPAHSLDESISCTSSADVPGARLSNVACEVPTAGPQPIEIAVPALDLTQPRAQATAQAQKLPLEWVFGWMRLFSARIPAEPRVQGTVDADLVHLAQTPLADWNGTVTLTMPVQPRRANGEIVSAKGETEVPSQSFEATVGSSGDGWTALLKPTPLRLGPGADLTLSGQASPTGYSFIVTGDASETQLASIAHALPQLADSTDLVPANSSTASDTIHPIALSCTRVLSGGQACSAPAPPPHRPARRNVHLRR